LTFIGFLNQPDKKAADIFLGFLIFFGAISQLFATFAGYKMVRTENYSLCIIGSACLFYPMSICCITGIPMGIWALITLNKQEVKDAFGN
jgi:hypothetical protein